MVIKIGDISKINKNIITNLYNDFLNKKFNKLEVTDEVLMILYSVKYQIPDLIKIRYRINIPDNILLTLPIIYTFSEYKEVMHGLLS